ncbi:MAG: SDR family NAD(P)-dependent oxidoreductase [Rectinemataceae bacterium]
METHQIATLLRGLALEAAGPEGRAIVATAPGLPAGSPPTQHYDLLIDIAADADEATVLAALRKAIAENPQGYSSLIAVQVAGQDSILLAAAPDLEGARAMLPGNPPAALVKSPPKPDRGSAEGRNRVVLGKVALVTGGAQGFGEEISRGLAASGALVWIADLNREGSERLAAELCTKEGRLSAIALPMDVSNEDSVAAAFAQIAHVTGGLDLVVSNAGVLKASSVLEQDLAAFDFVTRVNYTGFFLVTKHAARLMRLQRQGAPSHRTDIVQINSKSGLEGSNKNGSYAGSKFGSIGLVQSFALELVEYGIKVNAICPGNFFDGPLWSDPEKGLFVQYLRTGKVPGAKSVADVKAFYEAKVPMGRGCEGPDVMRAIYYLVEQEYETGQALPVTGGQVMLN